MTRPAASKPRGGLLESETCHEYVLPKLAAAGWTREQIVEQHPVTQGRIVRTGRGHRRDRPLRVDYLLQIEPSAPLAVVEAKRAYRLPSDGLQQGMRYARLLDLPLAYATNGHGIVEHDFDTGMEVDRDSFPTPDEAWRRCRAWKGVVDDEEAKALLLDLIVVDECHRGSASDESSWRVILEHFASAAQLGMTATPLRNDNVDTYRYFGEPIYEYSLKQGIDDGFLAPYRVRRVVLSPDAYGWRPDKGQLDLFGREIPDGLYETQQFERVVSLLSRTQTAARHLTEYLKRTDRMAKTIVFCVDSEHADQMRRELIDANTDLARQHPDYAVRIVSAEGDVGMEHFGQFADPESATPVIATTSKLLSTGVDIPTVKNIVLFKPIGSIVEFKQIIGRGTRLYPDEDKLSFEIIDYSGATRLFEDPEFDGPPELVVEEEIDDRGEVVGGTPASESESEHDDDAGEVDSEALEERGARKLYVHDAPVYIVAEGFYLPDPESGRLRLVEYGEYVAGQVRQLFTSASDLRAAWRTQEGRDDVLEALQERGITFEEIADRLGLAEADPLDLLVHAAWNAPITTRRDRAGRLRREQKAFFESFRPEAREVLEALLEKYAESGPSELTLEVLKVPPLTGLGTPVEIAGRFGGADGLRQAVDQMQELLYAA